MFDAFAALEEGGTRKERVGGIRCAEVVGNGEAVEARMSLEAEDLLPSESPFPPVILRLVLGASESSSVP